MNEMACFSVRYITELSVTLQIKKILFNFGSIAQETTVIRGSQFHYARRSLFRIFSL